MRSFVLAALFASSNAIKVTQHFADGFSDEEVIHFNPSNVQNNVAVCMGLAGEIVGMNCRSNNGNALGDNSTNATASAQISDNTTNATAAFGVDNVNATAATFGDNNTNGTFAQRDAPFFYLPAC